MGWSQLGGKATGSWPAGPALIQGWGTDPGQDWLGEGAMGSWSYGPALDGGGRDIGSGTAQ